jgi:hypothetical protein
MAQEIKHFVERTQFDLQRHLQEMQNHLSRGHGEVKISFASFQSGDDRMIEILEDQPKQQEILAHFLMEQRNGVEPSHYGGNHGASGSHGGIVHDEKSRHKDQA